MLIVPFTDMSAKRIPIQFDEVPRDDFSQDEGARETAINYEEQWGDAPEKAVSLVEQVKGQIAKVVLNKATTGDSVPVINPSESSVEYIKTPMTTAARKKRWREKHGGEARRKEREYLQGWRKVKGTP